MFDDEIEDTDDGNDSKLPQIVREGQDNERPQSNMLQQFVFLADSRYRLTN